LIPDDGFSLTIVTRDALSVLAQQGKKSAFLLFPTSDPASFGADALAMAQGIQEFIAARGPILEQINLVTTNDAARLALDAAWAAVNPAKP
jgi:hypothetical protein